MGKNVRIERAICLFLALLCFSSCYHTPAGEEHPVESERSFPESMEIEKDPQPAWFEPRTVDCGLDSPLFYAAAPSGDGFVIYGADGDTGAFQKITLSAGMEILSIEPAGKEAEAGIGLLPSDDGAPYEILSREVIDGGEGFCVRQDDTNLCNLSSLTGFETISSCRASGAVWVTDYRTLLCDWKEVPLPDPKDPLLEIVPTGFIRLGEDAYLAVVEQGPARHECALYPLLSGVLGPRIESTFEASKTACDGETTYFLRDEEIWRITREGNEQYCGSFADQGITTSIKSFFVRDGRLFFLLNDRFLVSEESGEPQEKSTVTIMGYVSPGLAKLINGFMRENPAVRIEVRQEKDEARQNLAIHAGEVDLLAGYDPAAIMKRAYTGKLLALSEFLPEEELLENIVKAGTVEGACRVLPVDFTLYGMTLPSGVKETGESFIHTADMEKALEALNDPQIWNSNTREWILRSFGRGNFEEWIDRQTGTARFESGDFIDLLRLCKRFAEDQDTVDANTKNGETPSPFIPYYQGFGTGMIVSLWEDAETLSLFGGVGAGKYTGTGISSESFLGVPVNCPHRTEVKAFLTYLFSEPTQRSLLESGEHGEFTPLKQELSREISEDLKEMQLNKAELNVSPERVMGIIRMADHFGGNYQGEINEIVEEEAFRYFAGEITAEKAAEYIQNRESIYLAEQG